MRSSQIEDGNEKKVIKKNLFIFIFFAVFSFSAYKKKFFTDNFKSLLSHYYVKIKFETNQVDWILSITTTNNEDDVQNLKLNFGLNFFSIFIDFKE